MKQIELPRLIGEMLPTPYKSKVALYYALLKAVYYRTNAVHVVSFEKYCIYWIRRFMEENKLGASEMEIYNFIAPSEIRAYSCSFGKHKQGDKPLLRFSVAYDSPQTLRIGTYVNDENTVSLYGHSRQE